SSIGEAREAPELAKERPRGMGANARKRLQERGIGRTAGCLGGRQQGVHGLVEFVDGRGEALVLRQEGPYHLATGLGGLAAVCRAPGLIPQRGRLLKREAARVSAMGHSAERGRRRLGEVVSGGKRGKQTASPDGA